MSGSCALRYCRTDVDQRDACLLWWLHDCNLMTKVRKGQNIVPSSQTRFERSAGQNLRVHGDS